MSSLRLQEIVELNGMHAGLPNPKIYPTKLRNDIFLSQPSFIAASDAPGPEILPPTIVFLKEAVRSPKIVQRTAGQHLEREYGKKPEAGAEVVGMAGKR